MTTKNTFSTFLFTAFILSITLNTAVAQAPQKYKKHRTGAIYGSWGYNEEWYTGSTVHIQQNGLGNDYDLVHVVGHDHLGWNYHLTSEQLTIPQYNYRLGYYFNKKQDMAIELNFDHTKYLIADGQYIFMKGTYKGRQTDSVVYFSQQNGDYYYLNNGANFFLFNFVKRLGLYHTKDNKLRIDLTGKIGIGPVIPHVQNSLFGEANQQQFQFGGWNTGVETALRVTFMRYLYFEFSQKADYARYSNLEIYGGTAKQNFGTYELILSGGVIIPTTQHNPMFMSTEVSGDKEE